MVEEVFTGSEEHSEDNIADDEDGLEVSALLHAEVACSLDAYCRALIFVLHISQVYDSDGGVLYSDSSDTDGEKVAFTTSAALMLQAIRA